MAITLTDCRLTGSFGFIQAIISPCEKTQEPDRQKRRYAQWVYTNLYGDRSMNYVYVLDFNDRIQLGRVADVPRRIHDIGKREVTWKLN